MPLDPTEIADLPLPVLNELADLEDRARRAEIALEREHRRVLELHDEVLLLRTVLGEMQTVTDELHEAARSIEGRLALLSA